MITHYADADLYHNMISGRSSAGILDIWNNTMIDNFSKLLGTVEQATFSSEYRATAITVNRAIDHTIIACYLGVPIKGKLVIFGDNKTVFNATSLLHAN